MFEYKVKLGYKEIKLYADTDIEEFFNINSIDYVRNMTDTVENRQLKEIGILNNIINEDLYKFNDELNTVKFLENDFEEHSIHYYQIECLVEYLKQLKRRINNEK